MAEIKVTASQLTAKADEMQNHLTSFKSEVDKMIGYERELGSMWEGQAQQAFRTAFNNDKGKMDTFADNVAKYIQALRESAKQYEAAEQKAQQIATTRKS